MGWGDDMSIKYASLFMNHKSIRFPNDLVEQVEQAIQGKDCTFSAFVVEAVRAALQVEEARQEESHAL